MDVEGTSDLRSWKRANFLDVAQLESAHAGYEGEYLAGVFLAEADAVREISHVPQLNHRPQPFKDLGLDHEFRNPRYFDFQC